MQKGTKIKMCAWPETKPVDESPWQHKHPQTFCTWIKHRWFIIGGSFILVAKVFCYIKMLQMTRRENILLTTYNLVRYTFIMHVTACPYI